jgi:TolA-binding protein
MKRAEAESYFALGKQEEGEKAFQDLVAEFPDSAWAYIG